MVYIDADADLWSASPAGGRNRTSLPEQKRVTAWNADLRSSFRHWTAKCSDAPREVCELALAHVNTNSIEAAYRRTDLFERRRALMESWSAFLGDSARVPRRYKARPGEAVVAP